MGDLGRFLTYWQEVTPPRGNAAERSPESVARVLRNARILQGYTLRDVAHSINVRPAHLEAIEEGRFRDLPPLVYAKGFVAAYADLLHLDVHDLTTRFAEESMWGGDGVANRPDGVAQRRASGRGTAHDPAERRSFSNGSLAALALVLAALAYGVWHISVADNRALALSVPPLPARFQTAAEGKGAPVASPAVAVLPPATTSAATPSTAAPLPPEPLIAVKARANSWVQVRNAAGQRFASLVLREGDVYVLPRTSIGMTLATGDLQALDISVDGKPIRLATAVPLTQYTIALDATRLLNGTALQE